MANTVSTMPSVQVRRNVQDESSRRRPSFCEGHEIELADGQTWILPPPRPNSGGEPLRSESNYDGMIRAMLQAEDRAERDIAELAFAIFLLHRNYVLSPADYQRLLGSGMRPKSHIDWQTEFRHIALEHLNSFLSRYRDL